MPAEQKGPRGFEMRDPEPRAPDEELPAPTFATFVLSLSTSALLHMGAIEDPAPAAPGQAEAREPNLPMARHTIDILEMIKQKTLGNLEPQEEELLIGVLHDLHMRFVEAGTS